MKRIIICILLVSGLTGCNMEQFVIKHDLDNRIGVVQIHRCFCSPSAYRYLIVTQDNKDTTMYNPINLPENYKDDTYKIIFSADLLNDSSVVYTNTATDALIEDFKVRNIRLTAIGKCSNLVLNENIDLVYGKVYTNYGRRISIRLDSVTEDSRCPYNVECVWAGNAKVRFNFTANNKSTAFYLNTSGGFRTDTIISGYKIQLNELKPYPTYPTPIVQKDYIARVKISE